MQPVDVVAPVAPTVVDPVVVSDPFSMWSLFSGADLIVQLVMIGLAVSSVWSWAIILHKFLKLSSLNRLADQFEEAFWSGGALDDLFDRLQSRTVDPMSTVFCAAMREWRRSVSKVGVRDMRGTLEQRIDRIMSVTVSREMQYLERYLGFLASLGSNGVIVGLFGTVVGIMKTFQTIAMQNIAQLAPSISEALFATAVGLIASIPAAIAYNKISSDINRYGNRLDAFCNEFSAIMSRQLEETHG